MLNIAAEIKRWKPKSSSARAGTGRSGQAMALQRHSPNDASLGVFLLFVERFSQVEEAPRGCHHGTARQGPE